MAATKFDASKIWMTNPANPAPMTIEEFDARLEASKQRLEQQNEEVTARLRQMEEILARQEP